MDLAWIFTHYFYDECTPLWVGYNSTLYKNKLPRDRVNYMVSLNESLIKNEIVKTALDNCLKIMKETGERYIKLTVDLAIFMKALRIQHAYPQFEIIFIHSGAFHLQMAYFYAIGKFIENCGLTNLLVNAELIASGFVAGLIGGKHYNRCKRIFTICVVVLKTLLIDRYVIEYELDDMKNLKQYLLNFYSTTNKTTDPIIDNVSALYILEDFQKFEDCKCGGEYGLTAQFYTIFLRLMEYYFMLSRSIRTGDYNLYLNVLPFINNVFFSMNLFNYARWLVAYNNNLLNVDATHPDIRETHFERGSFGVRRTKKDYSRQPTDLVIEETQNTDAASTAGVSNFTDSVGARQRWCITHSMRTSNNSKIYDLCGMKKSQDISAEQQKGTIHINNKLIKNLKDEIKRHIDDIDPFSMSLNKKLYLIYPLDRG